MTSYIQLLNKIEAFCLAHKQIQKYGGEFREQMPNFSTKDTKYPMVFVSPSGGAPLYDTNEITLDIYCVDIIQKGRENLNTIVSDCHLILTDLYIYFSQGSDLSIDVLGTPSQNPLNNLDLDYVAGWMMTITFQVEGWCVAAIPMGDIPSGQGCEDATYIVEYADGTPIESGTIASGATKTIVVPDCPACDSASWTLLDTDGNVLDSGTIASGGSANITAPDATVNINGSLWDTVLSGGTENISVRQSTGSTQVGSIQGQYFRIDDSVVSNSDASYSVNVKAEDPLSLPDSQINVNSVNEGNVVSVKTIDVNITDGTNLVTPDAVSLSGNILTVQVPSGGAAPVGATLMKTGQTTSYRTGDDGDLEAGRATDFFTLGTNNPFGNTNRFTDELGGSTYTNDIVIDWSTYDNVAGTVLGYYRVINNSNVTWNTAIDNCLAFSVGTFTSGWRLPNRGEMFNIMLHEGATLNYPLNYAPFNISLATIFYTSTTNASTTTSCFTLTNNGSATLSSLGKISNGRYFPCRTFTVTGTTLT